MVKRKLLSGALPAGSVYVMTLLSCVLATPSAAQVTPGTPTPLDIAPPSRPERPYRGLFGASVGSTAQLLTLEASIGQGFNGGEQQSTQGDPALGGRDEGFGTQHGGATAGNAKLSFSRTGERFGVYASNQTMMEYYPNLTHYNMLWRDVFTGQVYFVPHKSTRVSINPHFKDLPEFSLSDLFDAELGQGIPVSQDFAIRLDRYRRYGASLDVGQQLSKRARAFASFAYAHGQIPTREWTLLLFTGRLRYAISEGVGIYVGGQYGGQKDENRTPPQRRDPHPRIDLGVDYNKELSFSRRTKLAFSTGTAGTHDRSTNQTSYRLIGSLRMSREFGRTWLSELSYSRNVRHVESVNEPLFNDSVTLAFQGSFSRRLQFQSQIGKSIGRLGSDGAAGFDTYVGSAQLSVALTRQLGISTQYGYYDYTVTKGNLPIEANGKIFPHRMGAYLQVYLPIMRRMPRDQ